MSPAFFYSVVPVSDRCGVGVKRVTVVREAAAVKPIPGIEGGVNSRVEALGLEVVDVEWGGTSRKPMFRVRVDYPDSTPGRGVTVEDCARASRVIEDWLDEHGSVPEKYVLEVSSPGVDRPLLRKRDFIRFVGREIEMKGTDDSCGTALSGGISGVLEGVEEEGDDYRVVIRTSDESRVLVPRKNIVKANLVFCWNEDG